MTQQDVVPNARPYFSRGSPTGTLAGSFRWDRPESKGRLPSVPISPSPGDERFREYASSLEPRRSFTERHKSPDLPDVSLGDRLFKALESRNMDLSMRPPSANGAKPPSAFDRPPSFHTDPRSSIIELE